MDDKKTTFSRNDLYELVWSEPQTKVAERLGIKTWHLVDLCEKHSIPRPPSGFWTRQRLGRAVHRTKLPVAENDDKILFRIESSKMSNDLDYLDADFRDQAEKAIAREEDPRFTVVIQEKLLKPHPVVAATKNALLTQREDSFGARQTSQKGHFDVRVTKGQIDRAMLLLDAFAKACEKRGYVVGSPKSEWKRPSCIFVMEQEVDIRLMEKVRRHEDPKTTDSKHSVAWSYHQYTYSSTGQLTLSVGGRELRDTQKGTIESRMPEAMLILIESAINTRRREIEERRREERARLLAEKRHELNLQKKEELKRVEQLYEDANSWARSLHLREYLKAVRTFLLERDGQILPGSNTGQWLTWAEGQADRLDPLSTAPYSVLDEPDPSW